MGHYIPSTKAEQQQLLEAIGVDSVNAFFKDVPDCVLLKEPLTLSTIVGAILILGAAYCSEK